MLWWTVKIGVDESWVAEGFELTEEGLHEAMIEGLPVCPYEIEVKMLEAPDPAKIIALRGDAE